MKKILLLVSVLLMLVGCANTNQTSDNSKKIGVLQLLSHESLDLTYQGFTDYLDEQGIDYTIDFQNPEQDTANLTTMAESLVNGKCDLILAIATPPAQVLKTVNIDTPIVGAAITDYVDANIVDSNEKPGGLITGVSDNCDMNDQFNLIKKILPEIKSIGILYSSSEDNSTIQANQMIKVCEENNVTVEVKTIPDANSIKDATEALVRKNVDLIYVPTDNTVAGAMAAVAKVTKENKTPVMCGASSMVKEGGIISMGVDYYKLGKQAGGIAQRIMNGENPGDISIEFQSEFAIYYSKANIDAIGFELPQDIIDNGINVD